MPRRPKSREALAADMVARMPHVPAFVSNRMAAAFLEGNFGERGVPAVLERFFAHLEAVGRPFELVTTEDFATVTGSRTGFRTLTRALHEFAPEVPLASAAVLRREWDRWLNATYGKKTPKARQSTRIALLPEDWPQPFQNAIPLLDRVVRVGDKRLRPMKSKSRASTLQAVGMMWASRKWAVERGIEITPELSPDLIEVFCRFLLDPNRPGRAGKGSIRSRSAADYLERVRAFASRAELLDHATAEAFADIISALVDIAADDEPSKREKLREFGKEYTLATIVQRAVEKSEKADKLPAHTEAAARFRREAMVLALLVNSADRQGDLSRLAIGRSIVRNGEGLWEVDFNQRKTGRRKDNGSLWPITSKLIDRHIVGDRPTWTIADRLAELDGANLVSLTLEHMGLYYPSVVLASEFGISGHLVRTLITDAIRIRRPDAAWAAQFMLGHSTKWMQETYRSDFRETAVIQNYHAALEALQADETLATTA